MPFRLFYGRLVYFVVILVQFSSFGTYVVPRKIWQPWLHDRDGGIIWSVDWKREKTGDNKKKSTNCGHSMEQVQGPMLRSLAIFANLFRHKMEICETIVMIFK
jgi:hypothetical protein